MRVREAEGTVRGTESQIKTWLYLPPLSLWPGGWGGGGGEGRTGRGPEKTPKERVLALLPNLSVGPMRCRDMVMGAQCPMQVKRGGWDLTHSPARRRRSAARQGEAGVLIRTDAQCFGDFLLRTPAQVTQLRAKGTSLRSVHLRS